MPLPARHYREHGFAIAVDLGQIIPPVALTRDAFPNLAHAVEKITLAAHAQWQRFAQGAPMPNGRAIRNATGAYLGSITYRMTGDFAGEVYSELPYANVIEEGAPSRDGKRILGSSIKVRTTKKGERYLIIPFRHNHPNSVLGSNMPQSLHDWWQAEQRVDSHVTGIGERKSGTGAMDIHTRGPLMTPSRTYSWGTRVGKADLVGLGLSQQQVRRATGMVRFRKPDGAAGYGQHSQYLTFRVMKESSPGWIIPAREGMHPARTTAELLEPVAEEAFKRAVELDVAGYVGGRPSP